MKEITTQELYELYLDTLNHCGTELLKADNDTIEYSIFEEFDIGIISFFHINSLKKLYKANMINKNCYDMSLELRDKVMKLQSTEAWNINLFRSSEKWKEILNLADTIKKMINK